MIQFDNIYFFQMCWFNPTFTKDFLSPSMSPAKLWKKRLIRQKNLRLLLPRWEVPRCPKAGSYESICSAQSYCHGCDNTWGPSPEVFALKFFPFFPHDMGTPWRIPWDLYICLHLYTIVKVKELQVNMPYVDSIGTIFTGDVSFQAWEFLSRRATQKPLRKYRKSHVFNEKYMF